MKSLRVIPLALLVAASAAPGFPCSVCFGDPTSSLTRGAQAGVILLGMVVYFVLMAMAGIGIVWHLRARKLAEASSAALPPAERNDEEPPSA